MCIILMPIPTQHIQQQGVKSILEYKDTGDLTEILPNYLFTETMWKLFGEQPIGENHRFTLKIIRTELFIKSE